VNAFLWNTLLATVWMMITGTLTPANFALGFAIGYLILFFAGPALGLVGYGSKVRAVLSLLAFFLFDLVLSNLQMAYDVVSPRPRARPGVIAIPLDASSDIEVTLLANLITLTPGSLSLDVSDDRNTLYLHAMYLGDPEAWERKVKDGFERRILAVTR
jgi:multicomponent Na+:H+ antiporter subunit E